MTFCKTSKVPVPRKLSALGEKAENDDTEEVIEVNYLILVHVALNYDLILHPEKQVGYNDEYGCR